MMTNQIAKAIPVLGGVFSLGFKLGEIKSNKPTFPIKPRPIARETEKIIHHPDDTIETSRSEELFTDPVYDAFANSLYYPAVSTRELIAGSVLISLVLYGIHKYFLKS